MKNVLHTLTWAGLLLALLTGCVADEKPAVKNEPAKETRPTVEAQPPAEAQPAAEPTPAVKPTPNTDVLPEGLELGEFVDVDGARIYALIDESAPADTIYTTLDEAMAANLCTVREVGAAAGTEVRGRRPGVSGRVNTLLITNTGDRPIFLMAGDLVLGGKQDRILAESLVVAPNSDSMRIPVFCVEHGRWTTQAKDGARARSGYFKNTKGLGQCDVSVKKAALTHASQGAVWKSVAASNKALGVGSETKSGTFRATFDSKKIADRIDKNYETAKRLVGKGVVGFVVYVEGEAVALDAFDSVGLCGKLSEKLLRSYIVTGINGGYTREETVPDKKARGARQMAAGDSVRNISEGADAASANEGTGTADRTVQRSTYPNDRTGNLSEISAKTVKYTCNDKRTGKAIQRSFMRR